jgi:hypothetical protein
MGEIYEGHITRTTEEIKNFSTEDLTTKMLDSIINHKELETCIKEFNNNFPYTTFNNSLGFQLGRSMIKHCSPADRIDWKFKARIKEIMNDNDNNKTTVETLSIMNDFINAESKKSMERILFIRDIKTPDGKILKDRPVYDYSSLDSHDHSKNAKSILFDIANNDLIKHYYCEFIYYFPVTQAEFEKILFFFLTFLTVKQYSSYYELNDIYAFKKEINEIIRMRYIDINDRLIMSLIHVINTNPELQNTCTNIYKEIHDIEELTTSQVFNVMN